MSRRTNSDTPLCKNLSSLRLSAVLRAGLHNAAGTGMQILTRKPENTCAICHYLLFDIEGDGTPSQLRPVVYLSCQHGFHVDCVAEWTTRSQTCPLCREGIPEEDILKIHGEERKENDLGIVYFTNKFDGRLMRAGVPGGQKQYYKGERGTEHVVCVEFPNGNKQIYEGATDAEHKVRTEFPNGQKQFFKGEKGVERKVHIEFPSGEKQFFKGEKGVERKVRSEFPNGQKWYYEGAKGAEHKVCVEFSNGEKHFFEGDKDAERKVRIEFPNGNKQFYEGVRGAERRVRTEFQHDTNDYEEEFETKKLRTSSQVKKHSLSL